MITERILDQAIAAASSGMRYDQSKWRRCILGIARHIAGMPTPDIGPQPGEIEDTPRAQRIAKLMFCKSPDILKVMKAVQKDGRIDLSGADLSGVELRGANLSGANLSRANLSQSYLVGVVFEGANLSRADLSNTNLSGACFVGANLKSADLRGAICYRADFSNATLTDAVFDTQAEFTK